MFASIAIIGCSGGGNDPKSVAKKFFEAIKMMDIDEATKYATKDSKGMLDMMKMGLSFANLNKDSLRKELDKQKLEFSDPVINGDNATVTITSDNEDPTEFKLKKEDGQWKVAFDKNTIMKTGIEKMEQKGASDEELNDARKAMDMLNNPDSLRNSIENAGEALKNAGSAVDSIAEALKKQ
jgi:hypothetical protein